MAGWRYKAQEPGGGGVCCLRVSGWCHGRHLIGLSTLPSSRTVQPVLPFVPGWDVGMTGCQGWVKRQPACVLIINKIRLMIAALSW